LKIPLPSFPLALSAIGFFSTPFAQVRQISSPNFFIFNNHFSTFFAFALILIIFTVKTLSIIYLISKLAFIASSKFICIFLAPQLHYGQYFI
jgi:hypothetical protein